MTSPNGAVPEGAYVGTAGQSNSITDLNNLTEAEAKRRMQSQVVPVHRQQRDGIWGLVGSIADALFGTYTGSAGPLVRLSDGMTAMNNRLGPGVLAFALRQAAATIIALRAEQQ